MLIDAIISSDTNTVNLGKSLNRNHEGNLYHKKAISLVLAKLVKDQDVECLIYLPLHR